MKKISKKYLGAYKRLNKILLLFLLLNKPPQLCPKKQNPTQAFQRKILYLGVLVEKLRTEFIKLELSGDVEVFSKRAQEIMDKMKEEVRELKNA